MWCTGWHTAAFINVCLRSFRPVLARCSWLLPSVNRPLGKGWLVAAVFVVCMRYIL